jgi:hypothetical protein
VNAGTRGGVDPEPERGIFGLIYRPNIPRSVAVPRRRVYATAS